LFEEQVRRDTELMQKLRIMDYSLLTGIHNIGRGNVDNLRDGMLTVFQVSSQLLSRLEEDADEDS
jgi:1-phosphatidylinositol-4-phosphate 5-kinase